MALKTKWIILLILLILLIIGIITMGIKHTDTKTSGEKGYADEWNKDHKIDSNVECAKHQHKEHVIENRTDWPAGPVAGQIVFRTDLNATYVFDGTNWSRSSLRINYWSCTGNHFLATNPDVDDVGYSVIQGEVMCFADGIDFNAPVFLPHGAIVTGVIVTGNIADETWQLRRFDKAGGFGDIMAGANINTQDNTINFATIDNQAYAYAFRTSTLDDGDIIWGATITYTL